MNLGRKHTHVTDGLHHAGHPSSHRRSTVYTELLQTPCPEACVENAEENLNLGHFGFSLRTLCSRGVECQQCPCLLDIPAVQRNVHWYLDHPNKGFKWTRFSKNDFPMGPSAVPYSRDLDAKPSKSLLSPSIPLWPDPAADVFLSPTPHTLPNNHCIRVLRESRLCAGKIGVCRGGKKPM